MLCYVARNQSLALTYRGQYSRIVLFGIVHDFHIAMPSAGDMSVLRVPIIMDVFTLTRYSVEEMLLLEKDSMLLGNVT